jgi:hypothetical protein
VQFVLRLVMALAIFTSPILLFVMASRSQMGGMLFIVPLFGAIPAAVVAGAMFVPIEKVFLARGLVNWVTPAVMLAGSLSIVPFMLIMAAGSGLSRPMLRDRVLDNNFLLIMVLWIVLGAWWGACWRISAKLAV